MLKTKNEKKEREEKNNNNQDDEAKWFRCLFVWPPYRKKRRRDERVRQKVRKTIPKRVFYLYHHEKEREKRGEISSRVGNKIEREFVCVACCCTLTSDRTGPVRFRVVQKIREEQTKLIYNHHHQRMLKNERKNAKKWMKERKSVFL